MHDGSTREAVEVRGSAHPGGVEPLLVEGGSGAGSPWAHPLIWMIALVVLAPPLFYLCYGIEPFFIQNGVDPFIYAGYAFDSDDLITRYGYTYYSVRFGLNLPAEATAWAFGPTAGYLALRWLLAAGSVGVLMLWCRGIGRTRLVWIAGPLFLLNPITIRAVMTQYSDTVGVPYLVGAFALLTLPGSRTCRIRASLVAGALIGLSVHANLFLALPLGAALTAWAVVRIAYERRAAVLEIISVGLAIGLVTIAGMVIYWIRFGQANILAPSLDAAERLSDVVAADRAPTRDWLNFRPFLFIPLLAVASLAIILVKRRSRPEWYEVALVAMLVVISAIYLYQEFILEGFFLETYYYTSYFVGLTVLTVVLCIRRLLSVATSSAVVLCSAAVLLLPFVVHLILESVQVWSYPTIPVVLVGLAVLIASANRQAHVVAAVVLAIVPGVLTLSAPRDVPLAAGQPYRREPHYDRSMFNPDDGTLDQYALAARFMDVVPDWSSQPGSVVFWYPEDDETANLLGSTFLWRLTTITTSPPGLPTLDAATVQRLVQRTPRYLVIVARSAERVETGSAALRAVLTPLATSRVTLREGDFAVVVETLEFRPASCDADSRGIEVYWVGLSGCG